MLILYRPNLEHITKFGTVEQYLGDSLTQVYILTQSGRKGTAAYILQISRFG